MRDAAGEVITFTAPAYVNDLTRQPLLFGPTLKLRPADRFEFYLTNQLVQRTESDGKLWGYHNPMARRGGIPRTETHWHACQPSWQQLASPRSTTRAPHARHGVPDTHLHTCACSSQTSTRTGCTTSRARTTRRQPRRTQEVRCPPRPAQLHGDAACTACPATHPLPFLSACPARRQHLYYRQIQEGGHSHPEHAQPA